MGEIDLNQITPGVAYIHQGYIDYSKEVITERALANKYDGLKPVNRRILYTAYRDKVDKPMKSERFYGTVTSLHPHGGASVYQAMVLMTQKNGSWAVPVLHGVGDWGGVYKADPAAAPRYTEVKLHKNADLFFSAMHGVNFVPNYDSTETEPELLPVKFPAVLVNSTSGIAVGFGSNVPSFNIMDVCGLVTEYINDGSCHTVIAPDFVTGGYYVQNKTELMKLMKAGKGKIKLRAKTIVDGKKIICTEVPFGKTIQGLLHQINTLDLNTVKTAYDSDDNTREMCFTVECTSKNKVDETLYQLLKKTDLQYTYSANITVVDNGLPVTQGVWGIVEDWTEWRKSVLIKEYNTQIDGLKQSAREARAFMIVVNDYDKRMEVVRVIASEGRQAGIKYIADNFTREEVPSDLIEFCGTRSLPSYYDGGKYANMAANAEQKINALQNSIDNIGEVIKAEMTAIKQQFAGTNVRRTEVTTKDYEFVEDESSKEKAVDNSFCIFEVKNNFIKKLSYKSDNGDYDFRIEGVASDKLIAFDNRGRLLRIYGEDLPYNSTDIGTYLPRYLNIDETDDDYKITYVGKLDGKELMLLYTDGNVGFVDTSEWIDNTRSVKVLQKGIAVSIADKLGAVYNWEDIPDVYIAMDSEGRIGWARTSEIKHKDRTAKTRVLETKANVPLYGYAFFTMDEFSALLGNNSYYHGRVRYLESEGDFRGDSEMFIPF